jgi:hypothetical protein
MDNSSKPELPSIVTEDRGSESPGSVYTAVRLAGFSSLVAFDGFSAKYSFGLSLRPLFPLFAVWLTSSLSLNTVSMMG